MGHSMIQLHHNASPQCCLVHFRSIIQLTMDTDKSGQRNVFQIDHTFVHQGQSLFMLGAAVQVAVLVYIYMHSIVKVLS